MPGCLTDGRKKGTLETIKGYVEHIIYRNEANGYTVLVLTAEGEEVTCVGMFRGVDEGECLEAQGVYTEHALYGRQFKASAFHVTQPEDPVSMERYLRSGAVKGIGPSLASRIVKKFGTDTFRIMEEEPEGHFGKNSQRDRYADRGEKGSAGCHDFFTEVWYLRNIGGENI